MTSGVRFDRVSVVYDGTTVLDGLDLTVGPGEVMALLAPPDPGRPPRCGPSPVSCGPPPGGCSSATGT